MRPRRKRSAERRNAPRYPRSMPALGGCSRRCRPTSPCSSPGSPTAHPQRATRRRGAEPDRALGAARRSGGRSRAERSRIRTELAELTVDPVDRAGPAHRRRFDAGGIRRCRRPVRGHGRSSVAERRRDIRRRLRRRSTSSSGPIAPPRCSGPSPGRSSRSSASPRSCSSSAPCCGCAATRPAAAVDTSRAVRGARRRVVPGRVVPGQPVPVVAVRARRHVAVDDGARDHRGWSPCWHLAAHGAGDLRPARLRRRPHCQQCSPWTCRRDRTCSTRACSASRRWWPVGSTVSATSLTRSSSPLLSSLPPRLAQWLLDRGYSRRRRRSSLRSSGRHRCRSTALPRPVPTSAESWRRCPDLPSWSSASPRCANDDRRMVAAVRARGRRVRAVAWLDWLRPAADRTHFGEFFADVLDGDAWPVVWRKAQASIGTLQRSPYYGWLVPVAYGVIIWAVRTPGVAGVQAGRGPLAGVPAPDLGRTRDRRGRIRRRTTPGSSSRPAADSRDPAGGQCRRPRQGSAAPPVVATGAPHAPRSARATCSHCRPRCTWDRQSVPVTRWWKGTSTSRIR